MIPQALTVSMILYWESHRMARRWRHLKRDPVRGLIGKSHRLVGMEMSSFLLIQLNWISDNSTYVRHSFGVNSVLHY